VNDVFWIDVKFAATIEVQIFNRWGDLMLEMKNFTDRWDGKINGNEVSDGVYFHKYIILDLNGKTVQGHGNITIERK
jgi:gliding motility-associated-like protein